MRTYTGQGRDRLAALRDLLEKMETDNRDPDLDSLSTEYVLAGHGIVSVLVDCTTYPPEGPS